MNAGESMPSKQCVIGAHRMGGQDRARGLRYLFLSRISWTVRLKVVFVVSISKSLFDGQDGWKIDNAVFVGTEEGCVSGTEK